MFFSKKNLFVIIFFMANFASAGLILESTQLLFDDNKNELNLNVDNTSPIPTLVQSWVTKGDKVSKDFIITPPLFRIEGDSKSALRISKISKNLPMDRESLYYVNVKSVPPVDPNSKNQLDFIITSRITLRYRPAELTKEEARIAYKKLKFDLVGKTLIVNNPTPFYVPLILLNVDGKPVSTSSYVFEPLSKTEYTLKSTNVKYVTWNANDSTELQTFILD